MGSDRARLLVLLHRVSRQVKGDHVMAALEKAQHHVAAHAAEADHPHLHYFTAPRTAATSAFHPTPGSLPSVTRTTGRRREGTDCRSPSDCGCLRIEKLYGWPGIGTSLPSCRTTWGKRPALGPPFCSRPLAPR